MQYTHRQSLRGGLMLIYKPPAEGREVPPGPHCPVATSLARSSLPCGWSHSWCASPLGLPRCSRGDRRVLWISSVRGLLTKQILGARSLNPGWGMRICTSSLCRMSSLWGGGTPTTLGFEGSTIPAPPLPPRYLGASCRAGGLYRQPLLCAL